ncbi:hypothetical protein GQ42DRAFT_179764 [Ramicandelaber brevisporus]|nr:hypothetical protein GQ42DRAFT_179764 [Ramicandelaber brevisporus]
MVRLLRLRAKVVAVTLSIACLLYFLAKRYGSRTSHKGIRKTVRSASSDSSVSLTTTADDKQSEFRANWTRSIQERQFVTSNWTVHTLPSHLRNQVLALYAPYPSHEPVSYFRNTSSLFVDRFKLTIHGNASIPENVTRPIDFGGNDDSDRGSDDNGDSDGGISSKDGGTGALDVYINAHHTNISDVAYITGSLFMRNEGRSSGSKSSEVGMYLEGIHLQQNGSMYLFGGSKVHAEFAHRILDLMPNNSTFEDAKVILLQDFAAKLDDMPRNATAEPYKSAPHMRCEFQVYLQLDPAAIGVSQQQLDEYEHELLHPTGKRVLLPVEPKLRHSFIAYSPKCNVSSSAEHAYGLLDVTFNSKIIQFAAVVAIYGFIQCLLLIRQLDYTPTPSGISKISHLGMSMQTALDALLSVMCFDAAARNGDLFMTVIGASVFVFILVTTLEIRYLMSIYQVQRPETTAANPPQRRRTVVNVASSTEESGSDEGDETTATTAAAATPATAQTPTPPNEADEMDETRASTDPILRFYQFFILGLFSMYFAVSTPNQLDSWATYILAFILYSYWLPQAYRNVVRGARRGMSTEFILLSSLNRLIIPFYAFLWPDNAVMRRPPLNSTVPGANAWWFSGNTTGGTVLSLMDPAFKDAIPSWMDDFTQIELLGPRFFVPARLLPPTYDYHRPIPPPPASSSVQQQQQTQQDTDNIDPEGQPLLQQPQQERDEEAEADGADGADGIEGAAADEADGDETASAADDSDDSDDSDDDDDGGTCFGETDDDDNGIDDNGTGADIGTDVTDDAADDAADDVSNDADAFRESAGDCGPKNAEMVDSDRSSRGPGGGDSGGGGPGCRSACSTASLYTSTSS